MSWAYINDVLTVIATLGLFFISLYLGYKKYFEKPRIRIYLGDSIDICDLSKNKENNENMRMINIDCIFVNSSEKNGIIENSEISLSFGSWSNSYRWNRFNLYENAKIVSFKSRPMPIPVLSNNSSYHNIGYKMTGTIPWATLGYLTISFWRVDNRTSGPFYRKRFKIKLEESDTGTLKEIPDALNPQIKIKSINIEATGASGS